MKFRFRAAPFVLATALVPLLGLSACAPATDEGFEEEAPAATPAAADTGAGTDIETDAAQLDSADAPPPPATESDATPCDVSGLEALVGTQGSDEVYTQAAQDAGARTHRALGPTDMATMDFQPDRLNIDLDEDGKILGFRCG